MKIVANLKKMRTFATEIKKRRLRSSVGRATDS